MSATAFNVVAGLKKLSDMPEWEAYFTPEMRRLNAVFLRHVQDSLIKQCIAALSPTVAIWLMDHLFIPGLVHHYLFRKRYIEDCVREAITQGKASQVINLGAGFDTLALRLAADYPSIRLFEVDLPNTQSAKLHALEQAHFNVPGNCSFISADLSNSDLRDVLVRNQGIDPALPSMVVLEGVLMYLNEADVKILFASLNDLFHAPLRIIFGATVISASDGGGSKSIIDALLRRRGEGARWSCASDAMNGFVTTQGYRLVNCMPYKKLQRLYRKECDIRNVPEEDENYYLIERKLNFQMSNP